jgi:hypothetical protein
MLKGIFWLVVLAVLLGGGTKVLAFLLFVAMAGLVLKMFFAPFISIGKP